MKSILLFVSVLFSVAVNANYATPDVKGHYEVWHEDRSNPLIAGLTVKDEFDVYSQYGNNNVIANNPAGHFLYGKITGLSLCISEYGSEKYGKTYCLPLENPNEHNGVFWYSGCTKTTRQCWNLPSTMWFNFTPR